MTCEEQQPAGMAALGVQLPVIEKVLNHVSGSFGGIVSVYQKHEFANEKAEALARWAQHVQGLVEGRVNVVAAEAAMKPPSLNLRARAKLLEFVWNEVTGPQSDKDLRFMALDMGSHIRITPPTSDQAALREARRWNLKPLANLLRNHPALLGLEARNLIADILGGKEEATSRQASKATT